MCGPHVDPATQLHNKWSCNYNQITSFPWHRALFDQYLHHRPITRCRATMTISSYQREIKHTSSFSSSRNHHIWMCDFMPTYKNTVVPIGLSLTHTHSMDIFSFLYTFFGPWDSHSGLDLVCSINSLIQGTSLWTWPTHHTCIRSKWPKEVSIVRKWTIILRGPLQPIYLINIIPKIMELIVLELKLAFYGFLKFPNQFEFTLPSNTNLGTRPSLLTWISFINTWLHVPWTSLFGPIHSLATSSCRTHY